MNPKIHYLLEVTKLLGRLGYSLSADDTVAFIGVLTQIEKLTNQTIKNIKPRMVMRIPDEPPYVPEDDDDESL